MHIKRKQNFIKKINWRTTICLLVAICLFFVLGYLVIDYKYNSLPQQKEIEIIKLIEQRQQSLSEEELVEECMTLWYGHNIPNPGNSKIYERLRDRIKRDAENKICSLAEYYLYGRGIPKDEYLSFQYARLAATHNNPKGYLLVGNFFYDGVIQEYEWQKDSTCYYCVRKKECPTHMHKVNRVLVSNNIDSARFYWEKTIDNSPKGPIPGSHPKFEAIQQLERIYQR